MKKLNEYAKNITSQSGENGILFEIFRRLDITKGTCIEFGAADGIETSNTHPLWCEQPYPGVLEPVAPPEFMLQDFETRPK
jgi:hypothetical protein